jgi:hypothetical protein
MFKKKDILMDVEDQDEIKILKNIQRLHRVTVRAIVFPGVDAI